MNEDVLTVELLDKAIKVVKQMPSFPSPDNPYVLPPRLTWCQYPLFQQAWFEADLRSGTGVLPEKLVESETR